jgi:hypothetical protein
MGACGWIGAGTGIDVVIGRDLASGGKGDVAGRGGGICTGAVWGLIKPPGGTGTVPTGGSGEVGGRVAASRCI